jgi:hypothetical protein
MMTQHLDRLDGLALFLQKPALRLIELCQEQLHRTLLVVSGWRSVQEQMVNWQKGRTVNQATGAWEVTDAAQLVTRAVPGTSAHNVITRAGERASMAMDVIPLFEDGTADWDAGDDFWDRLYELSWRVGLDPLGDLTGAYLRADKGHFEEPAYKLKLDGFGLMLPVSTVG